MGGRKDAMSTAASVHFVTVFYEKKPREEAMRKNIFEPAPLLFVPAKGVRRTKKVMALCRALSVIYDSEYRKREAKDIRNLCIDGIIRDGQTMMTFPYKGKSTLKKGAIL
jgi:hypothetical protein